MGWRRSCIGAIWKLRLYASEELEGGEVGDLLRLEEEGDKGLDAILVLREDQRHDFYGGGWEEEYPVSAGLGDDADEAFDLGYSRPRDGRMSRSLR